MGKESVAIVGSGNWYVPATIPNRPLVLTSTELHPPHVMFLGSRGSLARSLARSLVPAHRGSAISKIAGRNILSQPDQFEPRLPMWVFEETLEDEHGGGKLTDSINEKHENVK